MQLTETVNISELPTEDLIDLAVSDKAGGSLTLIIGLIKRDFDAYFKVNPHMYDKQYGKYSVISLDYDYMPRPYYLIVEIQEGEKAKQINLDIVRG